MTGGRALDLQRVHVALHLARRPCGRAICLGGVGWGDVADALPTHADCPRIAFVVFYGIAGIVHLRSPDPILPIVPTWVPFAREVVLATGVCEIADAVGLLIPRLRRFAGVMLAVYAVCVFPANIRHAAEGIQVAGLPSSW